MTLRERVLVLVLDLLQTELGVVAAVALEPTEPLHGGRVRPSRVSEDLLELGLRVGVQNLPPPLYHLVRLVVPVLVDGVELPIVDIDLLEPIEHHLEFRHREHSDELFRDHAPEALAEFLKKLFFALDRVPLREQFNKLLFVQVDDLYIPPIWLEVDRLLALSAGVRIHGEILLEHVVVVIGQSIFVYPIDRLMNIFVIRDKILKLWLLSEQISRDGVVERYRHDNAIHEGLRTDLAEKVGELDLFLRLLVAELELIKVLVPVCYLKQANVLVGDFLRNEVHPLAQEPACVVDFFLVYEFDFDLFSWVDLEELLD